MTSKSKSNQAKARKKSRPFPMDLAEYQALAKRMEERYSADKRWEDLPVIHLTSRPTGKSKA